MIRSEIADNVAVGKLSRKGRLHCRRGEYQQAERALQRAVQIATQLFGEGDCRTCMAWNDYAVLCKYTGRFSRAAEIYRRILERLRSSDDRDDSDVATIYHNLGGLEHARGRHAQGEPFAREAVRIRRAVFGANHQLVAADEVALGAICDGIAKHAEARRLYSRALRIFRAAASPDSYEIAVTLNNLAASYYSTGQIAQAERYFKQALSLKEEIFERRHVDIALTLNNLALVYQSRGRKDLAKTHYLRAISIFKRALPAHHPKVKACQKNYVKLMQSEKILL